MKSIIAFLVLFITLKGHAQKDFEGMIRYQTSSPGNMDAEGKGPEEIRIFFAPGKILIRKNKEGSNAEDIIILLDSARVYNLDTRSRTYTVKKLRSMAPPKESGKEIIAGYSATPLQNSLGGWGGSLGGNATLWFADSLFFKVPEKFNGNDELLMVYNNRIMLKARIIMNYPEYEDMDISKNGEVMERAEMPQKENAIELLAMEVVPGKQAPSLFTIPDDYSLAENFIYHGAMDSTSVIVDSVAMMVDTMAVAVPEPPPPPKKAPAKPPVRKTAPAKSPARKDN